MTDAKSSTAVESKEHATPKERDPASFIKVGRDVALTAMTVFEDHLQLEYALDKEYKFLTKVMYPRGELAKMRAAVSKEDAHRIFCHIALIEGLKFIVTFPKTFDVTPIADGISAEAVKFFREVASHAWSQHMYENGVVGYWGPEIVAGEKKLGEAKLVTLPKYSEAPSIMCSNGGGKDSFLVMKVLEEAGLPIAVFQHARTEYGRLDHQHAVQERFFKHVKSLKRVHKISIIDDFTEGTFVQTLNPDLIGESSLGFPCQVGWPEMVFESLPFMITYGYSAFTLGNERSADSAQATWDKMEREVNHQWLKSYAAEMALRKFLQSSLINVEVFSVLKPIHDFRIYNDLKRYPEILPDIHSCNIIKPWCKKCSKCAYVWVNLMARFGPEKLDPIFQVNLFDDPDLQKYWRELLGMTEHNAWECVGETGETRLAFEACLNMGLKGKAMDVYKAARESGDIKPEKDKELLAKYDKVHETGHNIPPAIFAKISKWL